MKFIITESKIEKIAIKWLNKEYGNLIPYETEKYPNYIFYRQDKTVIFDYNKKNDIVYASYNDIWKFFEDYFNMEYEQIQSIMKVWVEEHYKLRVTTILPRLI